MPATTLDDGGWGAIATNFANALAPDGSSRARIYLQGAQYQKLLLEQEEMRRRMDAVRKSIEHYPSTLPESASMPLNADGTPQYGPVSPDMQREHTTRRQQQIYDNAAATSLAKSASDYAQGVHANRGMGAIAGGVPRDPRQQDVIQTQISSIGGSLPSYSATPHTYQPTDAAGAAIGPAISSRRIPEGPATMVSPTKAGPVNPFENDASADQRLNLLAQKAVRDPANMSMQELEEAAVHFANRYGVKNVQSQGPDGSKVTTMTRERVWPEHFNPLAAKVAEMNWWLQEREASAREGRPMGAPPAYAPPPVVGPAGAVSPDARTGGLVGGPAPAPAAPGAAPGAPGAAAAAPAPAPIVPPTLGGLPVGTNVSTPTQIAGGDATPLRKNYEDQPAVKKYEQAILPYEQFRENVKVGTLSSDISLIYNLAKILDPESVVRDGEMLIWKRTGGPADYLEGTYNKLIGGGAAMTPKVRSEMADTAERAMQANHAGLKRATERYRELATEYGIRPELVVPRTIPDLQKIDRKLISSIKPEGPGTPKERKAAAAAAAAGTSSAPAPGGGARPRTIRVNPQTGQIEDVP